MTTVEKKTTRLGETKIKELLSLAELAEIERKLVAEGIEHIMPKNTEYKLRPKNRLGEME